MSGLRAALFCTTGIPTMHEALPPHLRPPEQVPQVQPSASPALKAPSLEQVDSPEALWRVLQHRWESGISPHLNELRHRLLWSIGFTVFMLAASYPLAIPFLKRLQAIAPKGTQFIQLAPTDALFAVFSLMFMLAGLFSLPVWVWHGLRFLLPALTAFEKGMLLPTLLLSTGGALFGLWFGARILLPASLQVLLGFSQQVATPQISLNAYMQFCLNLLAVTALGFQMPLLAFLLGRLRLIHRALLWRFWREIMVGLLILAAVLTPTQDPITLGLVFVAMACLYGVCLLMVPTATPPTPLLSEGC
jgi:sec-independent protein translocase protein TatC